MSKGFFTVQNVVGALIVSVISAEFIYNQSISEAASESNVSAENRSIIPDDGSGASRTASTSYYQQKSGSVGYTAGNVGVVERNKAAMKKFERMINTDDETLSEELVAPDAPFYTPASDKPLYGGKGYLSVVKWMRKGFSDVQWKLEKMVAEGNVVAVLWILTGTHDGEFMGIPPTGKKISCTVMNFYTFNDEGKIVADVAAEGMIGILRGISHSPAATHPDALRPVSPQKRV